MEFKVGDIVYYEKESPIYGHPCTVLEIINESILSLHHPTIGWLGFYTIVPYIYCRLVTPLEKLL